MTRVPRATRRSVLAAGAAGIAGTAGAIGVAAAGGTLVSGCGLLSDTCKEWDQRYEPKTAEQAAGGKRVLATLADIEVGRAVTARTPDGDPILIARPTETTAVAFSATCTHHGCLVNPDGNRLHCPPHDGRFDIATGTPTGGPPEQSLPRVEVTVIDGKVVLAT